MELIWRLLPLAIVASTAAADRPIDSRLPNDKVPAILVVLAERLLAYGGCHVVIPFERFELAALLKHGALMRPADVELRPGAPHACHRNSAQHWLQARTTTRIATGFAVTAEEGVWRRHSWLMHHDGHIIETTARRDLYYGTILDEAQAERFVAQEREQR